MFRFIGGIIGFFMGSVFWIPGMIIGAFIGSSVGRSVDTLLFGSSTSSRNQQRAQDAYRTFYEQFYRQQQGYNHSYNTNSGYQGYQNYQAGASDQCYTDLGCSRTDSNDVIKKQYRKMVSQYHPDKLAAKGLSEAELNAADLKFKNIQNSYDQIKREKGI